MSRKKWEEHSPRGQTGGPFVLRRSTPLFGRHRGGGSRGWAWFAGSWRSSRQMRERSQAEIKNLRPSGFQHEDVTGLEVPVNDSILVSMGDSASNVDHDLHSPKNAKSRFRKQLRERVALEMLHDQVWDLLPRGDVEDRNDVVVAKPRRSHRFSPENSDEMIARNSRVRKDEFDGNQAVELTIDSGEDDSHPSRAKPPRDLKTFFLANAVARLHPGCQGCASELVRCFN